MRGRTGWLATAAAGILVAAFAAPTPAQDSGQEDLKEKYRQKIAEAWFQDGGWTDDYKAARSRAMAEGKPIFAYFTRSYSP